MDAIMKKLLTLLFCITALAADAPTITLQPPKTIAAEVGKLFALQVKATGTPPLHYQWYKNNKQLDGKIRAQLVIVEPEVTDSGDYYCRVSNAAGSANSDKVKITVK
jgi:hypothetical protein